MIPRTNEELDLYFLLKELEEARDAANKSIWQHGTASLQHTAQERYFEIRQQYLEKAKHKA